MSALAGGSGFYYANIAVLLTMNTVFFLWLRTLFERSRVPAALSLLYGILATAAMVLAHDMIDNEPFMYLATLTVVFCLSAGMLRGGTDESAFAALFLTFQMMAVKGMVLGGISLYTHKNMYQVLLTAEGNTLTQLLTSIGLLVTVLIFRALIDQEAFASFRQTVSQESFVLLTDAILVIFMLFNSYNYYYNMEMVWFSVAQILTSAIMEGAYAVALHYALQVSKMLNVEMKRQEHVRQMDSQIIHYRYMRTVEEADLDLKKKLSELSQQAVQLQAAGRQQEVAECLRQQKQMIDEAMVPYVPYSNNESMDAMLYATANDAEGKGIKFSANVAIPDANYGMSVRDLHQVLSILIRFSMQGIARQNTSAVRFLTITSSQAQDWFLIRISSSYGGKMKVKNGEDIDHPALMEVSKLVRQAGGKTDVSADQDRCVFTCGIRLHCTGRTAR